MDGFRVFSKHKTIKLGEALMKKFCALNLMIVLCLFFGSCSGGSGSSCKNLDFLGGDNGSYQTKEILIENDGKRLFLMHRDVWYYLK